MSDEGCFTINSLPVQDNQAVMVLNPQEINRLRAQNLKVKVGPIPVVFLSAKGQEADVKMGHEVGAEAYYFKPFTPEELSLRLIRILRKYGKL